MGTTTFSRFLPPAILPSLPMAIQDRCSRPSNTARGILSTMAQCSRSSDTRVMTRACTPISSTAMRSSGPSRLPISRSSSSVRGNMNTMRLLSSGMTLRTTGVDTFYRRFRLIRKFRRRKGRLYFCTGTLRDEMPDKSTVIASLQRAVTNYGATIGSHNGGLKNPVTRLCLSVTSDYWHWGPDEALDVTPPGYSSGKAYAQASILKSFQDIEGWLAGVDNGRAGCGTAGNCPRIWASPYYELDEGRFLRHPGGSGRSEHG